MASAAVNPFCTVRLALRRATADRHLALEATAPMRRLLTSDVTRAEVAAVIGAQLPALSSAEEALEGGCAPSRFFSDYRRRVPLAEEGLSLLGTGHPWHDQVHEVERPVGPRLSDQPSPCRSVRRGLATQLGHGDAWLGFRYVVEGASFGGALIAGHLAASLESFPDLRFFDPNGGDRAVIWHAVCAMLECELQEPARFACAARGAASTFDALIEGMEAVSQ